MINIEPVKKRNRGRPPRYPQLVELQRWANLHLEFADIEGQKTEIYETVRLLGPPKGCNHSHYAEPNEDAWVVKFSLRGKQYTVATLKLYEACCLYDCLLVWFENYRRHRPSVENPKGWFNFSREVAESHLETNDNLVHFLMDLEKFWGSLGLLTKRDENRVSLPRSPYSIRETLRSELDEMKKILKDGLQEIKDLITPKAPR